MNRNPHPGWFGVGLGLCCWLFAASTAAVQMLPLSLEELGARADLVLSGKVLSKTSQRDNAGHVFTLVELEVAEVWKGATDAKRFPIVLAGGTLGARRVFVPGQADYVPGEEVVAFLRLNQRGQGVTLGLAQGKFEVWQEAPTGPKYVRNLFHGRPERSASKVGLQSAQGTGRIALAELKQRVQGGVR